MSANDRDHLVGILKDVSILKSNYLYAVVIQILFSFAVLFLSMLSKMDIAIQLNRQSLCWTVEIKDVRAGTVLSPEFPAIDLGRFDKRPESRLGGSHILSQGGPKAGKLGEIVDVRVASFPRHRERDFTRNSPPYEGGVPEGGVVHSSLG